jgi:hypothetical protein
MASEDDLLETEHYGFTRVGEGESLSKNGYALTDGDVTTLDDFLYALENHSHTMTPRLEDPVGAPILALTTGGALPPDATFYYQVSYVDQWGLETAASLEAEVTTPPSVVPPGTVYAEVEETSGSLTPGVYLYCVTAVTAAGGETTASPAFRVRVDSGTTNRIFLEMPEVPVGAVSFRVYRLRPGQSQYYYLVETDVDYYDDGGTTEDQSVTFPAYNTTNADVAVEVTVPGGVFPAGTVGWRLYRTTEPGTYDGFNLVQYVTERENVNDEYPVTTWVDLGNPSLSGQPRMVSATISGGSYIDLASMSGVLPESSIPISYQSVSAYIPTFEVGKTYLTFQSARDVYPVSLDGTFVTTPPTTSPTGAQVGFELIDADGIAYEVGTDGVDNSTFSKQYQHTRLGSFDAERSTQANSEDMVIETDTDANNNQAVELSTISEYVERSFGQMSPGLYDGSVRLKVTSGSAATGDLRITFYREDTLATLYTGDFTAATGDYYWIGPVPFTVPTTVDVTMRITKATSGTGTYLIDVLKYALNKPGLTAGPIVIRGTLTDYPSAPEPTYTIPPNTAHFVAPARIYAKEGISETVSLEFSTSNSGAVNWEVASDQGWLTPDDASGSGSVVSTTLTADYSGLSAGSRNVATVTISDALSNLDPVEVEVVALVQPAVMGAGCNLYVQY